MGEIRLACYSAPWGTNGLIEAITQIAQCGYEGIECPASTVTEYEDRLHVFEEILTSSGLTLAGLVQPLDFLDQSNADEQVERAANAARFAASAGAHSLSVCHGRAREEPLTDDDWASVTAIATEMGERCLEFGIQMSFMPRAGRGVATEKDIKRFLSTTDPEKVGLTLDTAELSLAGASPQRVMKNHVERLKAVRYRDASASKRRLKVTSAKPGTTPLFGRGAVDFEAVSKALLSGGYDGWISLDISGESQGPVEAAENGYRFLLRKSGLFPTI